MTAIYGSLSAAGDEDTSKTLALSLPSVAFSFAAAQQAVAERAARAAREAAAKKRAEENPDGSAAEEELASDPPAQITADDPPAVSALLRHESEPSFFYVSFQGEKNRGVFICDMGSGEIVERRLDGMELRGLGVSRGGLFLAVGSEEGKVRVQPWGSAQRAAEKGWQARAHDGACAAATSFDDAFLVSGGATGVLLVHRLHLEGITEQKSAQETGQERSSPGDEVGDITAESAYGLEDAKQKEEADKLRAEAMRRQMTVKEQLAEIRRELQDEIERNRKRAPGQRVPAEEMEVDPGLRR
jgi:hypothetical protein